MAGEQGPTAATTCWIHRWGCRKSLDVACRKLGNVWAKLSKTKKNWAPVEESPSQHANGELLKVGSTWVLAQALKGEFLFKLVLLASWSHVLSNSLAFVGVEGRVHGSHVTLCPSLPWFDDRFYHFAADADCIAATVQNVESLSPLAQRSGVFIHPGADFGPAGSIATSKPCVALGSGMGFRHSNDGGGPEEWRALCGGTLLSEWGLHPEAQENSAQRRVEERHEAYYGGGDDEGRSGEVSHDLSEIC